MVKYLNQFIQLLFILILVARISVSQPKDSKDATSVTTKDKVTTAQSIGQGATNKSSFNTTTMITKTMSTKVSTMKGPHANQSSSPTPMIPTKFFSLLVLILGPIVAVVLFKYCKRKNSDSRLTQTVEVRPVSPTSTLGQCEVQSVSPVYCEVDIFQFPSREQRSETTETVETDVDEPTDAEGNSEDEYCYPENIEDEYETMNSINPPQASGEYAYAYDHVNINAGYMNTFPRERPTNGVEDDYEYPQNSRSSSNEDDYEYPQNSRSSSDEDDYEYPPNRRSSSDNEYRYAYDWRDPGFREATLSSSESVQGYTPLDKDKVDDNFYENYQTLSRESLGEKENETVPLEYVTVM